MYTSLRIKNPVLCLLDRASSWQLNKERPTWCHLFIISLFNAQHVSDVNTSILGSLWLICWVISWVVLLWFDVCWCYVVVWLGLVWYPYAGWGTRVISWVVLLWFDVCWCYVVVWLWWCGIRMQTEALEVVFEKKYIMRFSSAEWIARNGRALRWCYRGVGS